MKKSTQPTRDQLQEKITKIQSIHKVALSTLAKIISTREKQVKDLLEVNAKLIARRDAAYKDMDILEKKLLSSLHWKEAAVIVAVVSITTFILGLSIGYKIAQRGEKDAYTISPSLAMQRRDRMIETNRAITNRILANINYFKFSKTPTNFYSTNQMATFYPTTPAKQPKTYRSIVTRKGAEMLRK